MPRPVAQLMSHQLPCWSLALAAAALLAGCGTTSPEAENVAATAEARDGAALYEAHCASCHAQAVDRAPDLASLRAMTPQRILQALEFGSMTAMTHGRTAAERRAMAEYASGRSFDTPFSIAPPQAAMCPTSPAFAPDAAGPAWSGFGRDATNAASSRPRPRDSPPRTCRVSG